MIPGLNDTNAEDAGAPAPAADVDPRAHAQEISRIFKDHNTALVSFVQTRVGNEQEAREIAQEAYVRLLELEHPVAVSYLRWYLFKIARFIAIDRHRQRTSRGRLDQLGPLEDLDLGNPTESSCMAADQLAKIMVALQELPQKCQKAFLLHRFRDLSTVEVAAQMGITDRMVRHYIRKALIYCRLRSEGMGPAHAMREADK